MSKDCLDAICIGEALIDFVSTGKEPGFNIKVRDTTGAGDGFVAGMLAKILEIPYDRITNKDLHKIFRFANAVAALSVTRYGGIPSLPFREEIESFCNL